MEQKNCVKVSGARLEGKLLRAVCAVIAIVSLITPPAATLAKAQTRYTSPPTKWYLEMPEVLDKLFPDYAVEFEIPSNATNIVVYTTTAGVESRVLAFSTVYPPKAKNGKKVVKVVTGYSARRCSPSKDPRTWRCLYMGTLYQWACSLRIRYYR